MYQLFLQSRQPGRENGHIVRGGTGCSPETLNDPFPHLLFCTTSPYNRLITKEFICGLVQSLHEVALYGNTSHIYPEACFPNLLGIFHVDDKDSRDCFHEQGTLYLRTFLCDKLGCLSHALARLQGTVLPLGKVQRKGLERWLSG